MTSKPSDARALARALASWYAKNARDHPWRRTRDPWAILLSEVLLQQTRVETGLRRFPALLRRFPTPRAMADASRADVLTSWAGLGYYARARNLHETARRIVRDHGGRVPRDAEALLSLPGVGAYTAAAVGAIAFRRPGVPLDANILRVGARLLGDARPPKSNAVRAAIRQHLGPVVSAGDPRVLVQALMEIGSRLCRPLAPRCDACPLSGACVARRLGRTDRIPRPARRARPRIERWAFAFVADPRGRVLLERRGEGVLEGFWTFPGVRTSAGPSGRAALLRHLASLSVGAKVSATRSRHRWTFSHKEWRYDVYPARVATEARATRSGTRWVGRRGLSRLPVATAHRQILGRSLVGRSSVEGSLARPRRAPAPSPDSRAYDRARRR